MADPVLLLGRQIRHRLPEGRDEEERVVSESVPAAPLGEDLPFRIFPVASATTRFGSAAAATQTNAAFHGRANGASSWSRCALFAVGGPFPGEPGGAHPGSPQRLHRKPRVVRDAQDPVRLRVMERLVPRVFREGLPALQRLLDVGQLRQRDDLDDPLQGESEERPDLDDFPRFFDAIRSLIATPLPQSDAAP